MRKFLTRRKNRIYSGSRQKEKLKETRLRCVSACGVVLVATGGLISRTKITERKRKLDKLSLEIRNA